MNSQRAIGTGVLGGMVTATLLAVFITPLFYVLIASAFRRDRGTGSPAGEKAAPARNAQVSGAAP